MSHDAHDAHTGPIKTPAQLMWTAFFSFVLPVFIIIGMVYYVTSAPKDQSAPSVDPALATAKRIAPVGTSLTQDDPKHKAYLESMGAAAAAAPATPAKARDAEAVYKAQCAACHASGAAGAPKFGDAGAWGPRLGQGLATLAQHAIQGKGAMPAQVNKKTTEEEVTLAVKYMANAGGGKF